MHHRSRWSRVSRAAAVCCAVALTVGCFDSGGFSGIDATGSVRAFTVTTGTNIDGDGYVVTIGDATREVAANGGTVFSEIPPGEIVVQLSEVSTNCLANSASMTRTLTVVAGETVETTFRLICI